MAISYDPKELARWVPESQRQDDKRSEFERDRSRIIHSSAFRRLQGKTQVFGMGSSDFFRTRLTHSLEAAQIGKGLAINSQKADPDLVELACMSHDIGHPPFGHAGEDVLKKLMKEHGGFEANAQNLRIINLLELKSDAYKGLNFTRATIDALIKYPTKYSDVDKSQSIKDWKFYYDEDEKLVNWVKEGAPSGEHGVEKSFECQIMDWSDDIAYSTHDLEDGLKAGMITYDKVLPFENKIRGQLEKKGLWDEGAWSGITAQIEELTNRKGDTNNDLKIRRKKFIANLVHEFMSNTTFPERSNSTSLPQRYRRTVEPRKEVEIKCAILKRLVWETIISDERVATLERKGQNVITTLFDQLTDSDASAKLLPADFRKMLEKKEATQQRIVCDYIAGMTDAYILRLYSRLVESDIHSVFEML